MYREPRRLDPSILQFVRLLALHTLRHPQPCFHLWHSLKPKSTSNKSLLGMHVPQTCDLPWSTCTSTQPINPQHQQRLPSHRQEASTRVSSTTSKEIQSHEVAVLPGPPDRPERRLRGSAGERETGGLRFLLPRAAVAGVVLRHEAELLLPAFRQASGGLRDPRAVAQPRRWVLPAELQPRQRLRPLQGERPPEQHAQQLADVGVPDQRRPPVLGARVGEARHLRAEPLQRARLLPGRPPPARPAPRPRRPRRRGNLPRRRVLHAGGDQGRHP